MQTFTIECKNDAIAEHVYGLLSLLPKKEVVVKRADDKAELERHRKLIQESFDDIKNGRVVKTGKVVKL